MERRILLIRRKVFSSGSLTGMCEGMSKALARSAKELACFRMVEGVNDIRVLPGILGGSDKIYARSIASAR